MIKPRDLRALPELQPAGKEKLINQAAEIGLDWGALLYWLSPWPISPPAWRKGEANAEA